MGMFDNITVNEAIALPELPACVLKTWRSQDKILFQTKSFVCPCLDVFYIDESGKLKKRYVKYKDKNYNTSDLHDLLYIEEEEFLWDDTNYTGHIEFYEVYSHPDRSEMDVLTDPFRYISGQIEYSAIFLKGKLQGPIELVSHTLPQRRTDEELAKLTKRQEQIREKMNQRMTEQRQKYPTTEQKLIDQIYEETNIKSAIIVQEDIGQALSRIRSLVKSYRDKHDVWYTE
jgi:hypothetical protein